MVCLHRPQERPRKKETETAHARDRDNALAVNTTSVAWQATAGLKRRKEEREKAEEAPGEEGGERHGQVGQNRHEIPRSEETSHL